jgi:hypothetical protein
MIGDLSVKGAGPTSSFISKRDAAGETRDTGVAGGGVVTSR